MTITIQMPERFIPSEKEFNMYCAIKLYKAKYIEKDEAMKICGLSNKEEKIFDNMYSTIEKYYKRICGDGYADEDFNYI